MANTILFCPLYFRQLLPFPGDLLVSFFFPWKNGGFVGFDPWTTHKEYIAADAVRQIFVWQSLAFDLIKHGQIPLWNPFNFSGTYLLANLQSSIFYPLNILYFVLPAIWAWVGKVVLVSLLLSCFTYLFIRSLKLSAAAAVFGALAVTNISYLWSWQEILVNYQSFLFLPLTLWVINRYLDRKKVFDFFLIALLLALSVLGGHIQTTVYVFLITLFYLFFRRVSIREILGIFILSGCFAAVQLVPSFEAYLQSARETGANVSLLLRTTFPWPNFVTLFASDFLGNNATYNFHGFSYEDARSYFGVVALIFAFFGALQLKKNSVVRFFLFVAVFGIVFATWPGAMVFVNAPIPVLSSVIPARMIVLFEFAAVMIASYGFEWWWTGAGKFRRLVFGLSILTGVFLLLWGYVLIVKSPETLVSRNNLILPSMTFFAAAGSLLAGWKFRKYLVVFTVIIFSLAVFEQTYYFIKHQPFAPEKFVFPPHPVFKFLQSQANPDRSFGFGSAYLDNNFATAYRVFSSEGYDPLYIKRYGELLASSQDGKYHTEIPRSDARFTQEDNYYRNRLFDLLGVKYILDINESPKSNWEPEDFKFSPEKYQLVWQDLKWKAYLRKSVLPRYFLVSDYETESDPKKIISRLYDPNFKLQKTLILEAKPDFSLNPQASGTAELISYTPNQTEFSVRTTGKMLFFLSDADYIGWKAKVDGVAVPIYRADFAFRAVPVPSGNHSLIIYYDPLSFKIGVGITGLTFLVMIGFIFQSHKKKK